MKIEETIIAPVLTEKATDLAKNQVYTFIVNSKTNKAQVKNVLEKIYKVKVDNVTIMVRKGKTKKFGRKMISRKKSDKKIAYVKLKEGKIDLFPQA